PIAEGPEIERKPMSKPGSSFIPPRLTKHHGFMLTSASRTGSQKPMAMPGLRPHRHSGRSGLSGSGRFEGQISSPPTEIGNRHDQQMSVIGLTKLPVHLPGPASAAAGVAAASVSPARMAASLRSGLIAPAASSLEPRF